MLNFRNCNTFAVKEINVKLDKSFFYLRYSISSVLSTQPNGKNV